MTQKMDDELKERYKKSIRTSRGLEKEYDKVMADMDFFLDLYEPKPNISETNKNNTSQSDRSALSMTNLSVRYPPSKSSRFTSTPRCPTILGNKKSTTKHD